MFSQMWPRRWVEVVPRPPAPGPLARVAGLVTRGPDALAAAVRASLDRVEPDVLHLDGPATAPLARLARPATRVVLSAHDALSLRYREFGWFAQSRWSSLLFAARAVLARRAERRWHGHADRVVVTSAADAHALAPAVSPDRLAVVPYRVDLAYFGYDPSPTADRLVFTGNLSWPPNEDAAEYFALDVLPLIRRECRRRRSGSSARTRRPACGRWPTCRVST